MGDFVGALVVGAFVGDFVGAFVGALVGAFVGALVGAFVQGPVHAHDVAYFVGLMSTGALSRLVVFLPGYFPMQVPLGQLCPLPKQ